jgi:NAD-dependent histone deacetylase SIR2
MFHISALRCDKMASWYTAIAKLKLETVNQSTPSPAHWLIRAMDLTQKLLRLYTQNIDGLEDNTGMLEVDSILAKSLNGGVVRLHGNINKLWCEACHFRMRWTGEAGHLMRSGMGLPCPDCHNRGKLCFLLKYEKNLTLLQGLAPIRPDNSHLMLLRKRPVRYLRPDIVLYGDDQSNGEDIAEIMMHDLSRKPDALIVLGTSLSIKTLNSWIRRMASEVKRQGGMVVLVNKTEVTAQATWRDVFDYHIKDGADDWARVFVKHWMDMKQSDWDFPKVVHPNLSKRYKIVTEPIVTNPDV